LLKSWSFISSHEKVVVQELEHVSVLLHEAVDRLVTSPEGIYVDCTLGAGGHSEAIVKRLQGTGRLIALDQDEEAIRIASRRLSPYMNRINLVKSNFRDLGYVLDKMGIGQVDGFLFDLGLSSMQVDTSERGFSYHHDERLDMRMDRRQQLTAFEVVNDWPESQLREIISRYGEERFARQIARRIVSQREKGPIETTGELAELVKEAIPAAARRTGPHPARRTFQAIRIAVNDELRAFSEALTQTLDRLRPGGRIAVITFHSLEDRICKQQFSEWAKGCICPPSFPVCRCGRQPRVRLVTRRPVQPTEDEVRHNPRARSAKLRVAEKI
jgi:16S rRNA (cytosine1402-N4)-methyltransferase